MGHPSFKVEARACQVDWAIKQESEPQTAGEISRRLIGVDERDVLYVIHRKGWESRIRNGSTEALHAANEARSGPVELNFDGEDA